MKNGERFESKYHNSDGMNWILKIKPNIQRAHPRQASSNLAPLCTILIRTRVNNIVCQSQNILVINAQMALNHVKKIVNSY